MLDVFKEAHRLNQEWRAKNPIPTLEDIAKASIQDLKERAMIYEYWCDDCKKVFEILTRNRKRTKAHCPDCKKEGTRVLSHRVTFRGEKAWRT